MSEMNLGMKSKGAINLGSVVIPEKYYSRFGTGIPAVDNMFGEGGFIKGQVITISAARGAGKTTALLQILNGVMQNDSAKKCLYLSGEEYIEQLAFTAARINTPLVLADNETNIDTILKYTKVYDIIVIDSLASLTHEKMSGNELEKYAVNSLYKYAHSNDCVIIIIQHMTKDGKTSRGSSTLQHIVDTCITLYNVDAETYGELNAKAFCVDKNRFGQTKDTIFRMTKHGWDFTDPLREDQDMQNSSKSQDPRKVKRENELKKIIEAIKSKKIFRIRDLKDLVSTPDDLARFNRRLKELESMGSVLKYGRGQNARYSVKG
jgi:predicted ATP-dependent serine protease